MESTQQDTTVTMEFHVSRHARDRYQLDESPFALSGDVIFADLSAARMFAQKMNEKRDLVNFPERAVKAGQISAMGLIDETLHYVIELYRQQIRPDVVQQALDWLHEELGAAAVDATLYKFADHFPATAVYRRETTLEIYVESETAGVPHRQILLEEMLLLWLANVNPAFVPFLELFDDTALVKGTAYLQIISSLHRFFAGQPTFGPQDQHLLSMLRSPEIAAPYSLLGQLEYITERWRELLGEHLYRLLSGLNLIQLEPERFSTAFDRLSFTLLREILEGITWNVTSKQIQHYREMIAVLEASGDLTAAERNMLSTLLENLVRSAGGGYGRDFPQDYIGIGGDLL